jgi:glycosyltransferase involved in cell wall biosynthesis
MKDGHKPAPPLSVCLPSYNYASFLRECMDSIRQQTFTAFEWIVVDDASTDDSPRIIASYDDPRLRLFSHTRRLGAVETWNHCLQVARGEYVAFLCADDFYLPEKLEVQMGLLERNPALGLVHTDGYWADATGQITQTFSATFPSALRHYLATDHTADAPSELPRLAGGYNYIHLSNAVFRREAACAAGGFSTRFPYAADWDLWLRLAERCSVGYIARPLAVYRRHPGNLTRAMQASGQEWVDWYGVAEAAFQRWPPEAGDPTLLRREALRVIREHLMARVHANYAAGRNLAVRRDLRTGFRYDPYLRTDPIAWLTYLKSLVGGRRLKYALMNSGKPPG